MIKQTIAGDLVRVPEGRELTPKPKEEDYIDEVAGTFNSVAYAIDQIEWLKNNGATVSDPVMQEARRLLEEVLSK